MCTGTSPSFGNSRTRARRWPSALPPRACERRPSSEETLTDRSTGCPARIRSTMTSTPGTARISTSGRRGRRCGDSLMSEQHRQPAILRLRSSVRCPLSLHASAPPRDTAYTQGYTGTLTGSDEDLRPYRDGKKTPSAADIAHIAGLYQGVASARWMLPQAVVRAPEHGQHHPRRWHPITGRASDTTTGSTIGAGLWDEITRVPLVIRGPNCREASDGMVVVGLVDLSPTLLGRSQLDATRRRPRMDLGPTLKGAEGQDRVAFSITDPARPNPQFAARSHDHKLIAPAAEGMPVLDQALSYDLRIDPLEAKPDAPLPEPIRSPSLPVPGQAAARHGALARTSTREATARAGGDRAPQGLGICG